MSLPHSATTEYNAAIDFLLSRINYERTTGIPYSSSEFKLDRMRELMRRLGDPQLGLRAIHVAGTKGKGSTCAMIAGVLEQSGFTTGLYTSPHLDRLEQRFAIDGEPCTAAELIELVGLVRLTVEAMDEQTQHENFQGPTFFEITTAMVFLHFARRKVDFAVLEVGLGGRLDSTNVCVPLVTTITSISFDHMKQLGNTLTAIAREKAGIFKPGVPAVSGVVEPEAYASIRAVAETTACPLIERNQDFFVEAKTSQAFNGSEPHGLAISYREQVAGTDWHIDDVRLGVLGQHQAENAASAIATLRTLVRQNVAISDDAIRHGLARVRCPARIEVVSREPWIVLDTAHNLASIEALTLEVRRSFPAHSRILIFATSRDKDAAGMLGLLVSEFDHIIFTRYLNNPRARSEEESLRLGRDALNQIAREHRSPRFHLASTPAEALATAQQLATTDSLICITGSFFLAAELRPLLPNATSTTTAQSR